MVESAWLVRPADLKSPTGPGITPGLVPLATVVLASVGSTLLGVLLVVPLALARLATETLAPPTGELAPQTTHTLDVSFKRR
jgi:hypothetical protein